MKLLNPNPNFRGTPITGVWHLDILHNHLYWCDEAFRIFGLSREDSSPSYRIFFHLLHPEDRKRWSTQLESALKGEAPLDIKYRIQLPTGECRYLHQKGKLVFDAFSRPVALSATVQEITRREWMNAGSVASNPLIDEHSRPVIVLNLNGVILWVNNVFETTFEYTLHEVRGKRPGVFLQGPETDVSAIGYLRSKMAENQPFEIELLEYSKCRNRYWMLVKGQPLFDRDGGCLGFCIIQEHLTCEKVVQPRLSGNVGDDCRVFHQNKAPRWIVDCETSHFVEVNDAAVRRYGYSVGEFRRMKIGDIRRDIHSVERKPGIGAMAGGQSGRSVCTFMTKDGSAVLTELLCMESEYKGRRSVMVLATEITKATMHRLVGNGAGGSEQAAFCPGASGAESKRRIIWKNAGRRLFGWVDVVGPTLLEQLGELTKLVQLHRRSEPSLVADIRALIDQIEMARAVAVTLDTGMFTEKRLGRAVKLNVFRVVQEQLGNIAKFSGATAVTVCLRVADRKIFLHIHDNGRPVDPSLKAKGICVTDILSCAEMNNGRAALETSAGAGSLLRVEFPMPAFPSQDRETRRMWAIPGGLSLAGGRKIF